MKNKKWISLAAAVILAVTALPATVFAAKDQYQIFHMFKFLQFDYILFLTHYIYNKIT